ncbi:hypothetical protein [Streptosporangium sp. CA-115845]|uniref:hypothetical protein n=1 Tax=Streptosporangium sp. CA-115845 TaxID=3240071 RepID=UPI003D8D036C
MTRHGLNLRPSGRRTGQAHLFANYVSVTDYFIGLGVEGRIYAESNYVKGAKTITQDFGNAGLTWASGNFYDKATIARANSGGSTMSDWLRADGSVAAPPYGYSAGSASAGPPSAGAGVGGADTIPWPAGHSALSGRRRRPAFAGRCCRPRAR